MVSRAKKTVPHVKFSALNHAIACFKSRYKNVLLVGKQVWYVPFIWSLTWYLFWILRDVAVFNKSLIESNVLNYFGATISIAALIVASISFGPIKIKKNVLSIGTKIGINIGKVISFGETSVRKIFRLQSFSEQLLKDIRIKKPKQLKSKLEYPSPVESCVKKLDEANQKRENLYLGVNTFSRSINNFDQDQVFQEIASECLTCPNLIRCNYRQTRSNESEDKIQKPTNCRFANESSSKSAITS